MTDRAHMPKSDAIRNLICYEDLVESHSDRFDWPVFDENTASSLCYTSGTTGNPKGVLFTHRANVLHSYAAAMPDAMNVSARDVVMPVVPMFHANRSEEHTSELQSLMRISYAVFCLKKKKN